MIEAGCHHVIRIRQRPWQRHTRAPTCKLAKIQENKYIYSEIVCSFVFLFHLTAQHSLLPPEHAAELLPWYMQWSRDLAGEMHRRRLVRDKARRADTLPISSRPCDCSADWRCEPHDACFIHDSCFCPGSGSFPPVKPPRS